MYYKGTEALTKWFYWFQERTKNAQFIIISLRSNMFELADTLVGIYKTFNATKTATINPRFYENLDSGRLKALQDTEKVCVLFKHFYMFLFAYFVITSF